MGFYRVFVFVNRVCRLGLQQDSVTEYAGFKFEVLEVWD